MGVCLSVALFLTAAALISVGTVVISSDWVRRGRGWPELRILPRLTLRAAQLGSGLTFGHNLSLSHIPGYLVLISMAPCQVVPTTLLSSSCPNVRPDPGFFGFLRVARYYA